MAELNVCDLGARPYPGLITCRNELTTVRDNARPGNATFGFRFMFCEGTAKVVYGQMHRSETRAISIKVIVHKCVQVRSFLFLYLAKNILDL